MSRTPRRRYAIGAESLTRARTGLTQELRGLQRHYVTAMLVRGSCVAVTAATWTHWPAPALCALAGAVVVPHVAVVAGWSRRRGARPAPARVREKPASRAVLGPP